MAEDHVLDRIHLVHVFNPGELDHRFIATSSKVPCFIQHVGDTAGHPRSKVATRLAQHYHAAAGHVFTSVIAQGFDHGVDSAVAHTKPLTRNATNVGFAAGRTVERYVADDYVFLCAECSFSWWVDDDLPARQSLAKIVVC